MTTNMNENNLHHNVIEAHYYRQERISRIAGIFITPLTKLCTAGTGLLRLTGIIYGLRRAFWRSKLKKLGKFSDLGTSVTVRCPERLSVGLRSCIGHGSFLDASGEIEIGDHVLISHYVSINSITHQTLPPFNRVVSRKTTVCSGSWLGAHSIILEGVTIGENAIVGAGAVVTKDVPSHCIVAGVPARVIRQNPATVPTQ